MWYVLLIAATAIASRHVEALKYNTRKSATPPLTWPDFGAAVLGSSKPLFCYHLCGLKQRRDGAHPWIRLRNLCTCWDTPNADEHTYETKNCRTPKPGEMFRSRGHLSNCDIALCTSYLTETNLLETATAESAFICEFTQAAKITKFCLCDFKYNSNFDNTVSQDDKVKLEARYKLKIAEELTS